MRPRAIVSGDSSPSRLKYAAKPKFCSWVFLPARSSPVSNNGRYAAQIQRGAQPYQVRKCVDQVLSVCGYGLRLLISRAALEHASIGDSLTVTAATGAVGDAAKYVLKTVAGVELTIGQVIGLAGDYYTGPGNHAITGDYGKPTPSFEEVKRNAKAAADTLSGNAGGYLKAINGLFLKEEEAIKKALEEGEAVSVAV